MTNIMELNEHCRLCLVKDEVNVPIFEDEGDVRQVLLKITACLPVKIAKADSLPKRICDGCLYKLESFYQFWNTSVTSEKQLLQWLSETLNGDAEANLHALKQEPTDNLQTESQVFIQQQLAYQDTENYGEFPEETNYKPKKSTTKKEREREKRERVRERKREEAEEEEEAEEAPAPKRKRRAATKKPAIEIDDDDDDEEYVPPSAAVTKTEDDSEANDDPGDDYGADDNASDDNLDDETEPGPSGTTKSSTDAPYRLTKGGRIYVVAGLELFIKNTKPYKCLVCDYEARTNVKGLYRHMLHHVQQPFPCRICGKLQRTTWTYKCHLVYHKRQREHCDICDKYVVHLKEHMKTHTEETIYFPCSQCNKQFKSTYNLKEHVNTIHNEVTYTCKICNKVIVSKQYYVGHMRAHSATEEELTCNKCGKVFSNTLRMQSHIRHCGVTSNYVCDMCGKVFKNKAKLSVHNKLHSGVKEFSCNFCGKQFARSCTLRDHIRVHTKEKPHVCTYCGKGFSQRTPLVVHMRSHTGEKPYSCHLCLETFVSGSALHIHKRNHR